MTQDSIWVFYWNDCTWESAPAAISFHYTAVGAYKAMKAHLLTEYNDWYNNPFRSHYKFGLHKDWFIQKQQIAP
jgi:hypothetical protein